MTWLIESRWHAHKKYFAGSIIIIIIRIDQNLQDSLDAASTAGDAPKTEADPILPQTQKCSVLHSIFAWDSSCNAILSTIKPQLHTACVQEKSSSPQLQLRKIALRLGGRSKRDDGRSLDCRAAGIRVYGGRPASPVPVTVTSTTLKLFMPKPPAEVMLIAYSVLPE